MVTSPLRGMLMDSIPGCYWFKSHEIYKSHKLQYSLFKTTKQKGIVRVLFTFHES